MHKSTESKNFYAFIRHGERADNVDDDELESNFVVPKNKMSEIDPPLTTRGQTQAKKTGKFIKKYF